jgi:hypothetical protein
MLVIGEPVSAESTACLFENSPRLVDMWDMLTFAASEFVGLLQQLSNITTLRMLEQSGARPCQEDDFEVWRIQLQKIFSQCCHLELSVSALHCEELLNTFQLRLPSVQELTALSDGVERELKTKLFFYVPSSSVHFYQQPKRGWEEIIERFKDCQDDVEEMNRCVAFQRYDAAVFHALLVVEHGLIDLGKKIGVTDPKTGWDATYKRIDQLLKDRSSLPVGVPFSFVEQAKARLDSMKLAWRNKVNHAAGRLVIEKSGFRQDSAEEMVVACRSFMRYLADGI